MQSHQVGIRRTGAGNLVWQSEQNCRRARARPGGASGRPPGSNEVKAADLLIFQSIDSSLLYAAKRGDGEGPLNVTTVSALVSW